MIKILGSLGTSTRTEPPLSPKERQQFKAPRLSDMQEYFRQKDALQRGEPLDDDELAADSDIPVMER